MKPNPTGLDCAPSDTREGLGVDARASWTAAVLCRFSKVQRASESARGLAQSKSWRHFFAAFCLLVALFAQLSALHAQPLATNYVLSLGGTNGFLELPSGAFNDLEEVTIEGWVKWMDDRPKG